MSRLVDELMSRRALAYVSRQAEAEAEKIGVGVTADAQQIFDCLSRTYVNLPFDSCNPIGWGPGNSGRDTFPTDIHFLWLPGNLTTW